MRQKAQAQVGKPRLRPGEKGILVALALLGAGIGVSLLRGGGEGGEDDDDDPVPPTAPARAALHEAAVGAAPRPAPPESGGDLGAPPAPLHASAIERLAEHYPRATYRQLKELATDVAERAALRRAALDIYRAAHARLEGEG